ncbi:hypothetical protein LU11_gp269 [Pseudomonas phage Lu11]|uniref:hypothetical protein n=1 Tax=Pseudomonas phage Lu11 TaxID=1161927 RepID=UPI00025F1834|nr:hypothetical protein LU11_gp269 [Pseudomonas phage Lu11]AFH14800.1 hypothetical protein Lu11_0263 [Pseudomonas phage Lu11]
MIDYRILLEDLEDLKLTVCFRKKLISHPDWTAPWSWGHSGLTFVDAAEQAIHDMRR